MDTETTDRPLHDPAGWRATQSAMAVRLAASLGDLSWAEGSLFWSEIGGVRLARLETLDAVGASREHVLPDGIDGLGRQLRAAMATRDRGTWFSMTLTLESDGGFTARFNYDRRVYDNPATPFSATSGSANGRADSVNGGAAGSARSGDGLWPDDHAYSRDLAAFPRSEQYLPTWLGTAPEAAAAEAEPAVSRAPKTEAPETEASATVAAPYDVLTDAWGWPGVFESVEQQLAGALADRDPAHPLTRPDADALGRLVLTAVVADVLEPHRLATLLTLHAEAVSRRLLPEVSGVGDLDPDVTLLAAREASTPALLAVEAGAYGIVGDVVRARLSQR